MTRFGKIQIGLMLIGSALAIWEFRCARALRGESGSLTAQIDAQKQKLASRKQALDALEQQNRELQEAERRAGNQTLLSLMRERNAFSMAASQAAAQAAEKAHAFGTALAKTLDSLEHWQANEEARRAQMRVGLYQFFKLLNLPSNKCEAFIDLNIQEERRKAELLSALLQGRMTVDEAASERATYEAEHEQRCRKVLGDEGMSFLNGIAESMRNDEAKRLVGMVQDNMAGNQLNQDQIDRLRALLKAEILTINMDDIELFRPPEEWTQDILQRQQRILNDATGFLSSAQVETLKVLGAADLADRQNQMAARRMTLGIR